MADFTIIQFDPVLHRSRIPAIVDLHAECVEHYGTLLRFHPPFSNEKRARIFGFWADRLRQVAGGLRACFLALAPGHERELAGIVELGMPDTDTGPFRGEVEMLMVGPRHQRRGVATALMEALEHVARQRGRTLLQLLTTAGSPAAESLYPGLGYTKIGTVPDYGIDPKTKELVDGEYFYKDLRKAA